MSITRLKNLSTKNHVREIIIVGLSITIMFVGSETILGTANPFYVVSSGSMVPAISVHDVIMVQANVPFNNIKIGDIIVFKNPSFPSEVIVHRVAQILNQNPLELRTKGDANQDSIPGTDLPITKYDYVGKVAYVIPKIGYITQIIIPPTNYFILAVFVGIIAVTQYSKQK
jgi:signal peptidase